MCIPEITLYTLFAQLLHAVFGSVHLASLRCSTDLLWALLLSQSLHSADLARSLPYLRTTHARQAFRRIRRITDHAHLASTRLTPLLIKATLRLISDAEVFLVLDSTRCGRWEIFTLGVMLSGRVLPVAWSILPYPWPKGHFMPCVVDLLHRTLFYWPVDRCVHLLADRGFPSLKVFRELEYWRRQLPLGYTIRLRAGDWVRTEGGTALRLADLFAQFAVGTWSSRQACYQHRGKASPLALLVVGRGRPVYPAHQMGRADQARRLAKANRRVAHLLSKGQAEAPNTDGIWALLSTAGDCATAVANYARRCSTEGTYRDLKAWQLEAVAAHEQNGEHVDRLVGLAALGYLVQAAIGTEAGRTVEQQARARQQQWSTTDRLSIFWRGRQVLHDRAYDWRPWLTVTLQALVCQLSPESIPTDRIVPRSACMQQEEAA